VLVVIPFYRFDTILNVKNGSVCFASRQNKHCLENTWFYMGGSGWIGLMILKNLRISTGLDSIFSDQDWTRKENFHLCSLKINQDMCCGN